MTTYQPPVNKLLTYGDCRKIKGIPDYLELGFTDEHIPELIQMSVDPDLNWGDSESLEVWAPIHAWRVLGQLKAQVAIVPLINLFHELEDSDWTQELHEVLANIGPTTLPHLRTYLADATHGLYPRAGVVETFPYIARQHLETRDTCIDILKNQLEKFEGNERELNAFIIWALADDLKAVDVAPLMEKAFEAKRVDKTIVGNWYSVQVALGLKLPNKKLETDKEMDAEFKKMFGPIIELRELMERDPELNDHVMSSIFTESDDEPSNTPNLAHQRAKAKNKRKTAKQSRRKNRKRK
jgi:hypothetical protein